MNVFYNENIDINKKYCCYQTNNLINGKYYRGKALTENVLKNNYKGSGTALKSAFKKYGKNNFNTEIVFTCDNENDAFEYEKGFVVIDKDSYNMTPGGEGGNAGCIVVNNGMVQNRIHPDLLESYTSNGYIVGELPENFKRRREPSKIALEKKYGICTGGMITEEALKKSIQTHIDRYGSVCGHMHTKEVIEKSLKTREEKYGGSMAMCHTKVAEQLAFERSHATLLKKYGHITGRLQEFQQKAHDNSKKTFNRKKHIVRSGEFLEWFNGKEDKYGNRKHSAVKDFLKEFDKQLEDYPDIF